MITLNKLQGTLNRKIILVQCLPRDFDYKKFREIADIILFTYDMAWWFGLNCNPFEYCDVIITLIKH